MARTNLSALEGMATAIRMELISRVALLALINGCSINLRLASLTASAMAFLGETMEGWKQRGEVERFSEKCGDFAETSVV